MTKAIDKTKSMVAVPDKFPTGTPLCKSVKIPLPRAPIPMGRRFIQIAYAMADELWQAENSDFSEFSVLMALWRQPDRDQISLAEQIGVDRTNIGFILDRMESDGLIARKVNPDDRRARLTSLTKAGREKLERLAPTTAVLREKLFAPLTKDEREMFYDLLERIISANEHYSRPGAGRRKRRRG